MEGGKKNKRAMSDLRFFIKSWRISPRLDIGKIFSDKAVLYCTAAQGWGVTVPGGVSELWRCGTEGCGQWARWAGVGALRGLFQL